MKPGGSAKAEPRLSGPVLCLVGPTAIGKTALSLALAREFGGEIVGLDSMQVYRWMDIGTAKATPEEQRQAPHHLIDLVTPDQEYNLARYLADATAVIGAIHGRGRLPILVGGTGLYLRGLTEGLFSMPAPLPGLRQRLGQRLAREGSEALHAELARLDPESAARIHPRDRQRVARGLEIYYSTGQPWSRLLRQEGGGPLAQLSLCRLGLCCERERLYARINRRVGLMVEQGLQAEVEDLLARGYGPELKPMQAIGYRHLVQYLAGERSRRETLTTMARDTRRYAKRQLTWFTRDRQIQWFEPGVDQERIFKVVDRYLAAFRRR